MPSSSDSVQLLSASPPTTQLWTEHWRQGPITSLAAHGDGLTDEALKRATIQLNNIGSSVQLNSLLHSAGPSSGCSYRGGAGRGKIRVQPTSISRRAEGQPRGAARLGKGRRPDALPRKPAKRRRCLADSVAANVANAKSHGAGH